MVSSEILSKGSSVNGAEDAHVDGIAELSNGLAMGLEVEGQTEDIADEEMNNDEDAFSDRT